MSETIKSPSGNPLPEVVPIFPLTGVLLLPGMWLPLHIFEERYRSMVSDSRDGSGVIALVQPVIPRQDNSPPPEAQPENPDIYPVGCLGRLERCEESPDGRFLIALKGISRFRTREELPLEKGYRRVVADYSEFRGDMHESEVEMDPERLKEALRSFSERNKVAFDIGKLADVSGISLLNGLCMSLPFAAAEKQALLEAPNPAARQRMLLGLMGMGLDAERVPEVHEPPTLN